ncbi:MAG TPA: peptidoglycan editing factor PgeF [Ignavibacteria bacterium]|nr:peptidoglycan editing factor PgeF [Ignavibacteria bacterium]
MEKTKVIYSGLFKKYPELVFGFSTKAGGVSPEPYCMNLGASVGDDIKNVEKNREIFFNELGIQKEMVTFQKQIHSSVINYSDHPQFFDPCDAIFTDKNDNFLAVSVADCIPVFLYEPEKKIVAGIHSGWKGTFDKILTKTIEKLKSEFIIDTSKLIAYIGPGISRENYEVGEEVGILFDKDVRFEKNGKYYLDLKKDNYNQLLKSGLKKVNIEVSDLCTFNEKELLHSYRRDGIISGRMFGVIGMKD